MGPLGAIRDPFWPPWGLLGISLGALSTPLAPSWPPLGLILVSSDPQDPSQEVFSIKFHQISSKTHQVGEEFLPIPPSCVSVFPTGLVEKQGITSAGPPSSDPPLLLGRRSSRSEFNPPPHPFKDGGEACQMQTIILLYIWRSQLLCQRPPTCLPQPPSTPPDLP